MQYDGAQHSRCVQKRIREPTDAASVFNNSSSNEICMVAIPDGPCCCCTTYLNVPSGYIVLYQKWYKNQGQREPGATFCWPFWYRISHVVNAATITYSAPSRQVPTADNVSDPPLAYLQPYGMRGTSSECLARPLDGTTPSPRHLPSFPPPPPRLAARPPPRRHALEARD